MISVPDAATFPITGLPVAFENAAITSSGKPSGYVGNGRSVTMPIISQWPVVVSMPRLRSRRRPYADGASRRGGQPRSGMMFPRPRACIAGTSRPPTASATWAIVDEPAVPKSAASGRSPAPTASSTITHARGTRVPYRPPRAGRAHPKNGGLTPPGALRPGVCLEVRLAHVVGRHVRVHLGRLDAGVAEHLLHAAQVAAALEQVGGERVPQRVRRHVLGDPGLAGMLADELEHRLAGDPLAAVVQEEDVAALEPAQVGAAALQVDPGRLGRALAHRHDPLLRALPGAADDALGEVDVGDAQGDELGHAQAGAVEQLEHRPV